MSDTRLRPSEHREATRLAWSSLHVPLWSLLVGTSAVIMVASAVLTILAQGPSNPIP